MASLKELLQQRAAEVSYDFSNTNLQTDNVKDALDKLSNEADDGHLKLKHTFWSIMSPAWQEVDMFHMVGRKQAPYATEGNFIDYKNFYISIKENKVDGLDVKDLTFSTWLELETFISVRAERVASQYVNNIQITCYNYLDPAKKIEKIYGMNTFFSTLKGRKMYKNKIKHLDSSVCNWENLNTFVESIYKELLGYTNGLFIDGALRTVWFPQNQKRIYDLIGTVNTINFSGAISGSRQTFNNNTESYQNVSFGDNFNVVTSAIYGIPLGGQGNTDWYHLGTDINDDQLIIGDLSLVRVYLLQKGSDEYAFFIKPIGQDIFRLGFVDDVLDPEVSLYIEYEGRDSYKKVKKLNLTNVLNSRDVVLYGNGYSWVVDKIDISAYLTSTSTTGNQSSNTPRKTIKFFWADLSGNMSNVSKSIITTSKHLGAKARTLLEYSS